MPKLAKLRYFLLENNCRLVRLNIKHSLNIPLFLDVYPHPPSRFQLGSTSQAVGVSNGTERQRTYPLGCRSCETRTGQYVPATHIGLPCGHVNFCDQCNDNEKFMSIADPNDRARCAILTVGHL